MADQSEVMKFLTALAKAPQPAQNKHLPPGSPRPQDKARQYCRKHGLAMHVGKYQQGNPSPGTSGWIITEAGKAYLEATNG